MGDPVVLIHRSTQANWLEFGYQLLQRILQAMFLEAKSTSTVIGVDGLVPKPHETARMGHLYTFDR